MSRLTQEPFEHQAATPLGGADGRLRDGRAAAAPSPSSAPSGDALVVALDRRHDVPDQLRGARHEAVHGSSDGAARGVRPISRLSHAAAPGRGG